VKTFGLLGLAGLAALVLTGLNEVGVISADEPRYAAIGREMAASGDWVEPRLWGRPWLEKPPLLYWLIALGHKAGFPGEWAPRLPVATVSFAFLLFFFRWLRREFSTAAAVAATGILATSAGWFSLSRVAVTDLPMAACFSAAMLLGMSTAPASLAVCGVLWGLAVLAKGLPPLVLAAPLAWWHRARLRVLAWPVAMMLATALPWYWMCWSRFGKAFVDELFWRHHFARFFQAQAEILHPQPWWFYVPVLVAGLFPWSVGLAALINGAFWSDTRIRFFGLWTIFTLVVFSASQGKLPTYLLPLFPPAAALLGIRFASASPWFPAAAVALFGLVVPTVIEVLPAALDRGVTRADWKLAFSPSAAGLALVAAAASRYHRYAPYALVTIGLLASRGRLAERLEATISTRPLWNEVRGREICLDGVRRQTAYGLEYYAGRPLPECAPNDSRQRVGGR